MDNEKKLKELIDAFEELISQAESCNDYEFDRPLQSAVESCKYLIENFKTK